MVHNHYNKYAAYFAWLIAWASVLGSLFFSEIWHLPPCILCWYQRILMYPLVVIIGVGILTRDIKKLPYYVLPLSIIGIFVAAYHNLLYYNIVPEAITPCQLGVSCTTKFFEWFGFVTIPLLSLLSFVAIAVVMTYLLLKNNLK